MNSQKMDTREIITIIEPFNFWNKEPDTGIPRPFYIDKIKKLSSTGQVIVAMGVRRGGKTTVILQYLKEMIKSKQIAKEKTLYINLEEPKLRTSKMYAFHLPMKIQSKEKFHPS